MVLIFKVYFEIYLQKYKKIGQGLPNLYHGVPASAHPGQRHQNYSDKPWEQALCTLVNGQNYNRKIEAVSEPKIQHQKEYFNSCMPKFRTYNTRVHLPLSARSIVLAMKSITIGRLKLYLSQRYCFKNYILILECLNSGCIPPMSICSLSIKLLREVRAEILGKKGKKQSTF